ncbi:hypothetical protein PN36_12570 [Candidatus Thiomargarita nelsonii]|uniref:Uncharacterized protein n=1 Tax=Candidatus Thiomargarita nelsonii TaxID=1003181 RepID=A0A4E0QQX5_9GAMM|nr:hypothetical protein PN36_12570 [Candidatus Thiomargarita nelsonii]
MNHKLSDILESKALALDCCFFSHPKLKLWIPKDWKTYGSVLTFEYDFSYQEKLKYYLTENLTRFPNVGVKGELTANVLYKKKDDLINDKLCLGEDAKTLITQTEAWLNEIFDGAKVEIPHSDTNILALFLNTSASRDRFKPINVGFGYTYILPIIVSGLIAHLHPKAQSRLTQFLAKVSRCGVDNSLILY